MAQIIGLRFLVADAMEKLSRSTAFGEPLLKAQQSVNALNRLLLSWVRQLEQRRARETKQAASTAKARTDLRDRQGTSPNAAGIADAKPVHPRRRPPDAGQHARRDSPAASRRQRSGGRATAATNRRAHDAPLITRPHRFPPICVPAKELAYRRANFHPGPWAGARAHVPGPTIRQTKGNIPDAIGPNLDPRLRCRGVDLWPHHQPAGARAGSRQRPHAGDRRCRPGRRARLSEPAIHDDRHRRRRHPDHPRRCCSASTRRSASSSARCCRRPPAMSA